MLVVENVTIPSPAETLDIRVNDRLLTYNGQRLLSPAALLALEENTFGAQQVILRIARDGIETEVLVPTGKLGFIVRPELPEDVQFEYDRGKAVFEAKQYMEAAEHWSNAAQQAGEKSVSAWLYTKGGAGILHSRPADPGIHRSRFAGYGSRSH